MTSPVQFHRRFALRVSAWTLGALLCAASAAGARGAGVTVITHGFNSDVDSWIIPMTESVSGHPSFRGTTVSCYQIEIINSGGQFTNVVTFLGGAGPTETDSGEILIKLEWSTLDTGGASSGDIAGAAATALLSSNLIAGLNGRPLVELPLHFIGHSRGGSVISEMARLLGAQGVWVDQITMQDPRPVGLYDDAAVTTYANVLYSDNYWQTLGNGITVPNGQSVFGAYNRRLTSLPGGNASSHSDTHLWYHGTIRLDTPFTVDGATLTASERSAWWTALEAGGTNAGFRFSRIGRGNRLSNEEPLGAGNGRISDGFNKNWNLGGGLAANRSALPANNGAWPNLIRLHLASTNPVTAGGGFPIALHHQSGASAAGTAGLEVFLDSDGNPWNGNEIALSQAQVAHTGTAAVLLTMADAPTDPLAVAPGEYLVFARISDGARRRCLYAPETLQVLPSVLPPAIAADPLPLLEGGVFAITVSGHPGQTVVMQATTNFTHWTALATNVFTHTLWQFMDADAGSHSNRFYRAMLVP